MNKIIQATKHKTEKGMELKTIIRSQITKKKTNTLSVSITKKKTAIFYLDFWQGNWRNKTDQICKYGLRNQNPKNRQVSFRRNDLSRFFQLCKKELKKKSKLKEAWERACLVKENGRLKG